MEPLAPFLSSLSPEALIAAWGLWAVLLLVMVESIGVPVPGETALIAAALYAGTTQKLDLGTVIAVAALGAVIGDNIGYLIGRRLGLPLALRYGARIGLDEARLKVGRYLFRRHGVAVVFLGRFVALLRTFAALLAGLNAMPWPRFLLANAAGALCWAAAVGGGAALFGRIVADTSGSVRLVLLVGAVIAIVAGLVFFRRHERRLITQAEAAFPGPLEPSRSSL